MHITGAAIVDADEMDQDECSLELYKVKQGEDVRHVDINPELPEEKQQQLRQLVYEFKDVFTDVPRVTNLGTHETKLTSSEPITGKPYPLPFAMREVVDKEIETMLQLGIIESSTAPYASPIVLVKKPDGSNRICIHYCRLNKITLCDPEPMPQTDAIFSKLAKSKYFSKFDLSKGYWQVPVSPQDRYLTTFVTHSGFESCHFWACKCASNFQPNHEKTAKFSKKPVKLFR